MVSDHQKPIGFHPQKLSTPAGVFRPGAGLAFHETIVITMPFGPSAFVERHFCR